MPLVFFPPTFFKESRAPPPESAGNPRRRVHPATVPTEPPTDDRGPGPLSPHFSGEMGTPAGQAAPPGRCAPRWLRRHPPQRVRSTGLPLVGGPGLDWRRLAPARWVPARSRAGARCGTVYPSGGPGSYEASGRSAPLPRLPGGGPHFSREMGRKRAGGKPPGPRVYGPLAAARSFWRSCRIVPVMGLFRCPSSYPDLGTFFHKMLFQHIFYSKMRPKSVLAYRRKQPLERIRDNNRQNERVGTSGP